MTPNANTYSLLLIWGFVLPFQDVHGSNDSYRDIISRLVDERKSIQSLRAEGTLERKKGIRIEFSVFIDGGSVRTDQTKVEHLGASDQEGRVRRTAIVGKEKRSWHSLYGAELDFSDARLHNQLGLRYLGLTILPAGMVPNVEDISSSNVLSKMLVSKQPLQVDEFEYEGVSCKRVFTFVDDAELSVFFDNSDVYRGCSYVEGLSSNIAWVREHAYSGGINFPTSVRTKIMNGTRVAIDETVELSTLAIGASIDPTTFEFSGLGVKNGDKVDVRNGSLGPEGLVKGVYLDGRIVKIPDGATSILAARSDNSSMKFYWGIGLVACAVIAAFLYHRRGSVA